MEEYGFDEVTDYVVARGVAPVIYAWCATHPRNYKAVICSSARQRLIKQAEDIYCLPEYDATSGVCTCTIRVDRFAIHLNNFRSAAPAWLAVWQARLLHRLFGRLGEVNVVDLDTLSLETLLTEWEKTEVKVHAITSRHRFSACVLQFRRRTGRLLNALSELQELQLLPSPYEGAALAAVEHMPSLRRIFANACRVEYLKPLRNLYQLQELQFAQTQIRDRELHMLAELPQLTTLDLSGCSQITSLDPLSSAPSLRTLRAANCERLARVAQLSSVSTLRLLDLSEDVFLPSEFASFLARTPPQLHSGYFLRLRWPREDPPRVQDVLSGATQLHMSYCTLPNIRWLCGAHALEQLYLNHTNVTENDLNELVQQLSFLRVLSLSYCEHLHTNLDFVRFLPQLTIVTVSRSSLPVTFPELELLRRSMTVNIS